MFANGLRARAVGSKLNSRTSGRALAGCGVVFAQPEQASFIRVVFREMEDTMKQIILAAGFALALTGAAYAQTTTTEWYVVQDASTKKCTVVDKKPTATTTTVVSNGVFKTKTEAETGMKTIKVCTN